MKRCHWDGTELSDPIAQFGDITPSEIADPFGSLPEPVAFTPEMEELADRYCAGDIQWECYAVQQACQFLRPRPPEQHRARRKRFSELKEQVEGMGYRLPQSLITLVNTDSYMDRLHHNTIGMNFPQELWHLPDDSSKLMFLVFSEGQGCGHWHLLLSPDGSHSVVVCDEPFGCPSDWPGEVLDMGKYEIRVCASSIDEWLVHYFRDSKLDDLTYQKYLTEWFGFNPNG